LTVRGLYNIITVYESAEQKGFCGFFRPYGSPDPAKQKPCIIMYRRRSLHMNETLATIKKRSSIRAYKPEKLSREELDVLLEAGLSAPTAANRQEVHFVVVDGDNPVLAEIEEEKNAQRGLRPRYNFYYDAPTVIFLYADPDFHWGTLDCGIAV
jgi:hypothetical protein